MMKRAYATLELKAAGDGGKRTFSGVATTPATDRMGDVVEPKGAVFKLPIPLLWQHNSAEPIGWVRSARVTREGIAIEGEVADIPEDGKLKDRLAEAWQSIKSGLVRGLSIGFSPIKEEPIDQKSPWGPTKFLSWEWLELSAVTIPANQEASITAIKALDERMRKAAPGRSAQPPSQPARAGATQPKKGSEMNYTQEALAALQEQRTTKAARMDELMQLKKTNGQFSEEERAEFNGLDAEIENLDDEIRVTQRHVSNIATAKSVDGAAHGSRGPSIFVKKTDPDDKFQGQAFTRKIIARAAAHLMAKDLGYAVRPSEVAEARWGKSHKQLVAVMKANEVAGGGSGSGEWGAELVQVDGRYMGDFIAYLYAKTVFDRLPLREVPARVTIKGQDGASTGYWIGESKAIKVTTGDFSNVNTTPYKVAAITQFSKELMMDSDPAVELLMRDSLEEALRQRIDSTFLSTSNVSNGVSPAGILYNLSIGASNGPDEQSVRTDYRALMANFITAKNVTGLYWVTTPTLAVGLGSMVNALGQPSFPGITVEGGSFMGYPMITGDNVGSGDVILLKPSDIWKIGDGGVNVSVSDVAMIESSSNPSGAADTPTAADQALTSMFQTDSVAIKVTRRISFGLRRSTAVAYIGDAAYGAEAS